MGIPRNDFADAFRKDDYRDEDQYRADREYWAQQLAYPRSREPDAYSAGEAHHARWQQQRSDYRCLGSAAYQAKYGTITPAPDRYIASELERAA